MEKTVWSNILQILTIVLLLICANGIVSCSLCSSTNNAQGTANVSSSPSASTVPPGHCRVLASVVSIIPVLDSTSSGPCSTVPCNATIRIDKIIGYGAAFGRSISEGNTITLHFVFTVRPTTKDLFPTMDAVYPGLSLGDSFTGDIQADRTTKDLFTIYSYQKREK